MVVSDGDAAKHDVNCLPVIPPAARASACTMGLKRQVIYWLQPRSLACRVFSIKRAAIIRIRGSSLSRALSREPNLARARIGSLNSGSGCGRSSPRLESFFSEDAERAAGREMALDVECVLEGGMNGEESLG